MKTQIRESLKTFNEVKAKHKPNIALISMEIGRQSYYITFGEDARLWNTGSGMNPNRVGYCQTIKSNITLIKSHEVDSLLSKVVAKGNRIALVETLK